VEVTFLDVQRSTFAGVTPSGLTARPARNLPPLTTLVSRASGPRLIGVAECVITRVTGPRSGEPLPTTVARYPHLVVLDSDESELTGSGVVR